MSKKSISKSDLYKRFLLTADWYVNSQLGKVRPHWNADTGRFLYYYFIPDDKHVPGINWTQGRGISVLVEAYKLSKKKIYLDAAIKAAQYLEALQYVNPEHKDFVGMFREETPQVQWGGLLDSAQAASALILLSQVSKDKRYLKMGTMFCDFALKHFKPNTSSGWPSRVEFWPKPVASVNYSSNRNLEAHCISYAIAIPYWHAYQATKNKKYIKPIVWAADKIIAHQIEDGSLIYMLNPEKNKNPKPNHHHGIGKGKEKFTLRNDDGIVTVVLAAYKITKQAKYLNFCTKYADWIVSQTPSDRPYCVFPVQANNVLDIGKVAKKDYSKWVKDNLEKRLLDLQVTDKKVSPMGYGGFRGEDEEGDAGIFGGKGLDYVTTRVTCYSSGTLIRLSGKGHGGIFSVFGV